MKVLMVDENSDSLYLLEKILKKSGYITIKAEDGVEALEKLNKNKVDAIISDVVMPRMDGFKLCSECKKDDRFKSIPFLIYTSDYRRKQDENFALRIGAEKFLVKPQEPANLLKILNETISENKKGESALSNKSNTKKELYQADRNRRMIKKLEDKVKCLNSEISKRKKTEDELYKKVRELDCLYSLANLTIRHDVSLEKLFESAIENMRSGMQYPELVCCRVMFDEKEVKTDNFRKTKWKECRDIKVKEEKRGILEVYYLKKKPGSGKAIFSREEKRLVHGVSEVISINIERKLSAGELEESYRKINRLFDCVTKTLTHIIEAKDPYTSGHQKKVAILATAIAEEMELDEETVESINTSALIHDIGNIQIPASILAKPGRLTDLEFKIIKAHPTIGYEMLKDIEFPYPVADIVLQHHERLDGSGYPKGLTEKDISLEARIIAVADAMEAMTSHRPYRPALGLDKAIEEINKGNGKEYDQKIVDISIKLLMNKTFKKKTESIGR